tara:strand:- start:726 stop:1160 length:435 start_codon:yes stop_codon:yes gene_type:complete
MLISCTSCQSKYLVNSADLKPNGRNVKCARCGNTWYQDNIAIQDDENLNELEYTKSQNIENNSSKLNKGTNNLPSTYVKENKVSFLNSFLVLFFTIALIVSFWVLKNLEINTMVLLKYYISEFYFNLKLIFNDIAKIIYELINL